MPTIEMTLPATISRPRTFPHPVFDDGVYSVTIHQHFVRISKTGGAEFNVPNGHAWYDRVSEADYRLGVEDLYAELAAAIG